MNIQETIKRILREETNPFKVSYPLTRIEEDRVQIRLGRSVERHFGTVQNIIIQVDNEDITGQDGEPGLGKMNIVIKDGEIIVGDIFIPEKYRRQGIATQVYQKISDHFGLPIVNSKTKGFNQTMEGGYMWKDREKFEPRNLQESIRKVLREELNSDDIKSRQEEAAELIKRYGHFSSPNLRYLTLPLYAYIENQNFGRLKELGVKYRFTPINEINLNGTLSRFIKERGVFNGIGGNIIRLYNDEPVTKSDISRIKRKIQNIIDEFNSKLRTNYHIDAVVGDKSSDTLRNQLNQKLTDGEYSIEPTYNNIGIKISRGFEDEYLATIPMDEIDKPQMLD